MSERSDGIDAGAARLVALDWGTTTLRAFLLGDEGAVLNSRSEAWGIMQLPSGGFPAAFEDMIGAWRSLAQHVPVIASGMIGSAQGWVEAPYCRSPAGAAELARSLAPAGGGRLLVVPGVMQEGDAPNVMRGEETQIVGALAAHPELAERSLL